MKKIIFLLTLIVLQSYSLTVLSQDLQFYREDIVFTIDKQYAATNAEYYFCNTGSRDIRTALFYPFPESAIEFIDSIHVEDISTKNAVPYRYGKSGIFFEISLTAYGQSGYRVFYCQKLTGNHFIYILKSTESWRRPLEFASYDLIVPVNLTIDSLSYVPDTSFVRNNRMIYEWKKKDFMPGSDFEVWFK